MSPLMKPNSVRNNARLHRFEMDTPAGVAVADYRIAGNLMTIFYTEVPFPLRGRGYGKAIVAALQEIARERGLPGITLGAQLHAIVFYERLGYIARGDVFLDANMPHRWMDLKL